MNLFAKLMVTSLVVALVLAIPVAAQVGYGVKGGLNVATLIGDDDEGLDSKTGLVFGGFFKIPLGPSVSFQPEVLFTQKGAKETRSGITIKVMHDYIEIPVLLKYDIPTQSTVTPAIYAGLSFGLIMSAKGSIDILGTSIEADIANEKSTEFGLVLGGSIDFGLGTGKFVTDLRYSRGLSELYESVLPYEVALLQQQGKLPLTDDYGNALDVKTSTISLTVGYAF